MVAQKSASPWRSVFVALVVAFVPTLLHFFVQADEDVQPVKKKRGETKAKN